jgi:hypothetical protein
MEPKASDSVIAMQPVKSSLFIGFMNVIMQI